MPSDHICPWRSESQNRNQNPNFNMTAMGHIQRFTNRISSTELIPRPAYISMTFRAWIFSTCLPSVEHNSKYIVSQKVPTFKLSVTLSNLNRFSKLLHEIRYKIRTQYPPHLRHVATLPWKIKNAIFLQVFSTHWRRKSKQLAFLSPLPLLFIHTFRYFQCLK